MGMTEEAREARRQYKKEWARKNADKVKRYQENYWQHKAEQQAGQDEKETDPGSVA